MPREARYTLVAADYLNTYYGRLARQAARSTAVPTAPARVDMRAVAPSRRRPAHRRAAAAERAGDPRAARLELYDQALDELHYAQKIWGDSSAIQATLGLDISSTQRGRPRARGHQRDEARLPAVHGRGRRDAAAGVLR